MRHVGTMTASVVMLLALGASGRVMAADQGHGSRGWMSRVDPRDEYFAFTPPDTFGGPRKGQDAPNVRLKTLDGRDVELADYVGQQPVVLEFGSYTCPVFRQRHGAMEELHARYGDRATFLTIYTVEAHPQGDPSPYTGREWVTDQNQQSGILYRQPVTESERSDLAHKARADLGMETPILIDDMENRAWQAYGQAPNAAYLVGADGRIALRQGWFEPEGFEQALEREVSTSRNE